MNPHLCHFIDIEKRIKQMKKERKKQYTPVVIVCVLILLLLVIGLAGHFISKYIPTSAHMI